MLNNQIQTFRNLSRAYSDASIFMHEAIARKAGLSGTDHKYLGLILQKKELTAGELAKLTGLTTGAVTGLIDRLEEKGLVERRFTKEDRRKVIIVAKEENAMRLLEPLFANLQAKTLQLLQSFSEAELQVLQRYFREATQIMEATATEMNHL